jgi:hypothetical protein
MQERFADAIFLHAINIRVIAADKQQALKNHLDYWLYEE